MSLKSMTKNAKKNLNQNEKKKLKPQKAHYNFQAHSVLFDRFRGENKNQKNKKKKK